MIKMLLCLQKKKQLTTKNIIPPDEQHMLDSIAFTATLSA